jgi:hypothetical protein
MRTCSLEYFIDFGYVCGIITIVVLLCTRFPTLCKKRAGATDRYGDLYNCITFLTALFTALLILAIWQGGGVNMVSNLGAGVTLHFAITVGSRVEGRT